MSSLLEKLKIYPAIAKGIYHYNFYGPPCKSWDLKTLITIYVARLLFGSYANLNAHRKKLVRDTDTLVKNSTTESVTIPDKFREKAYNLVKDHLKSVYGNDKWYDEESIWSNSPPLEPEWVIPAHLTKSPTSKAILYIHGGGYLMGGFSTYRSCLETLAQGSDSIVLGAQYRLAPDYSAPCQLEDALAHVLYLTSPVEESGVGLSFDQIVVSGDSAGGGLTCVLNHFMRDANIGKFAGSLVFSPWVDLKVNHPSCTDCIETDVLPTLTGSDYELAENGELAPGMFKDVYNAVDPKLQSKMIERGHYLVPAEYLNSPIVSPLCDSNFKNLPPTLIISGEVEMLRDNSYLYQELINKSYTEEELSKFNIPPSTMHHYSEMYHDFTFLNPDSSTSDIAFKRAINFIKQCHNQKSSEFEEIKANNPINILKSDKCDDSSIPLEWRSLYLSTVNDHELIPFTPNYKRVEIKTWRGSN